MAVTGVLGARLYVGATALVDIQASADALADFTALSAGVEVGLIENFGNFGKKFQLVSFQAVADGRNYKLKGGYDAGSLQLVLGQDLTDAGQAILKAYADAPDQNTYPFKIVFVGADAASSAIYFGAKVFTWEMQMGPVNNVLKAMVEVQINTPIFVGTV